MNVQTRHSSKSYRSYRSYPYRDRDRYDTPAKSEIDHSLLQVRVEIQRMKKMRAYRGLGRDRIGRIGRTGPYRIGAQLPIRGKYNRIGGFIGNYRKFRHENRGLDEGGALAASSQPGASMRRRLAGRGAICSHCIRLQVSRRRATGGCLAMTTLVWLLEGREVVKLTEESAAIRWRGGSVTIYRRNNKAAFGPLGESLDDFQ